MVTKCDLKSSCTEFYRLRRRLGNNGAPPKCRDDRPCRRAFDDVRAVIRDLNVDNVTTVTQSIRKICGGVLPVEQTRQARNFIFREEPFYCPEIDVEVRQPCRVRSCAYWTDNSWTRNCIWFYRLSWHRESLENKELTFLLDCPPASLVKRTHAIVTKMRRHALKNAAAVVRDTIVDSAEEPPEEESTEDSIYCVGCGAVIDPDAQSYRKQGYIYCSAECVELKPPVEIRIEEELRLPIERVLKICIDSFASKRPMCHALNITSRQLIQICAHHGFDTQLIS